MRPEGPEGNRPERKLGIDGENKNEHRRCGTLECRAFSAQFLFNPYPGPTAGSTSFQPFGTCCQSSDFHIAF